MISNWTLFLTGVCAATFMFSAIFFLKFWRSSRDPFFLYFAFACGLISLERWLGMFLSGTLERVVSTQTEANSWLYLIRFGAFVIISVAIVNKNRKSS